MSTLTPGQTVYDSEIHGFRVRCLPSGTISFGLQRTTVDSKREHIKLGLFPGVTPDQARKLAQEHTGRIAAGDNPAAKQRADAERNKNTVNHCSTGGLPITLPVRSRPRAASSVPATSSASSVPRLGTL